MEELIKGKKFETTPSPKRFKSSGKNRDDIVYYIGKKSYGCTAADRNSIEALAEQYGSYIGAWNAYEDNKIILYGAEVPILKALAVHQEKYG